MVDLFFRGVSNDDCLEVVTTPTSVDLAFQDCRILFRTVNGTLRADIAIEGGMVISTVTPKLTATGPLGTRSVDGSFVLRQPIVVGAAPIDLEGDFLVTTFRGGLVEISTAARWSVDPSTLCVDLTWGARLAGEELGDLGPIALSGERIASCHAECPTSGHVELSFGKGSLLTWDYDGSDTVIARGPRGKLVEIVLPCADEGQ